MTGTISMQHDSKWWATWNVGGRPLKVWARGDTELEALQHLDAHVSVTPIQLAPEHVVATLELGANAYAAHDDLRTVIAVGSTVSEAVDLLDLHVPVPEPTDKPPAGTPPKLEKKPLPPV